MHKTRIITALILVSAFIPALFFLPNLAWALIMLLLSIVAAFEWAGMAQFNKTYKLIYLVVFTLIALYVLWLMQQAQFAGLTAQAQPIFLAATVFWLLLAPIWLAKRVVIKQPILMGLLGIWLLLPMWLAFVVSKAQSPWLLLMLLMPIWLADSAAYFAGKRFGKHKLAPSISPGKTWEGVAGAMTAVTLYAAICYMLDFGDASLFIIMWVIAILGIMGDLFESMMKRQANIKDSGHFLPGHGGILDRMDGVISSLPIALFIIAQFGLHLDK